MFNFQVLDGKAVLVSDDVVYHVATGAAMALNYSFVGCLAQVQHKNRFYSEHAQTLQGVEHGKGWRVQITQESHTH